MIGNSDDTHARTYTAHARAHRRNTMDINILVEHVICYNAFSINQIIRLILFMFAK